MQDGGSDIRMIIRIITAAVIILALIMVEGKR